MKWVLFYPSSNDEPELYVARSDAGTFETRQLRLAASFDNARAAYHWAANQPRFQDWKVGLR